MAALWPNAYALNGAALALTAGLAIAADRWNRRRRNRGNSSDQYLAAQLATHAAGRAATDLGALHLAYSQVLGAWAEGSGQVFLSDGSFAAVWPNEPLPLRLVNWPAPGGAASPESLAARGADWEAEITYLRRNQVGAVIGAASESGERLVAAFSARHRKRAFSDADLREGQELLAAMLHGTHLMRMRQRARGTERLNFYARYAPQFAHELRNGLYLQTELVRTIAAGRLADIRPEDAEAALERTAQIDRLCDHFFNVGMLFNRPVERIDLRFLLETLTRRLERQFDGGGSIVLQLWLDRSDTALVFGNQELLSMAIVNLVKNAVEACNGTSDTVVEIGVSRQMDKMHLIVRDNGRGLPEDRRGDPFAPGKSHKREGMGLGLSIVRDCMEAMGGTAGVRASGPDGTCFELTLSCAERISVATAPCQYLAARQP
ncbi:MAG TPA: HAMP domain-containing sensor histidine kinase [Opitutaceae bacterium]|jgi:signal transduction histidine kinase